MIRAIVTTFALIGMLIMAAGSHEAAAMTASTEMPHPSAEIELHTHSHGDSQGLSWTEHGQPHDGSGHDHGFEVIRLQIFQIQSLGTSADFTDAGTPAYCAPIFDVESPPRV